MIRQTDKAPGFRVLSHRWVVALLRLRAAADPFHAAAGRVMANTDRLLGNAQAIRASSAADGWAAVLPSRPGQRPCSQLSGGAVRCPTRRSDIRCRIGSVSLTTC